VAKSVVSAPNQLLGYLRLIPGYTQRVCIQRNVFCVYIISGCSEQAEMACHLKNAKRGMWTKLALTSI